MTERMYRPMFVQTCYAGVAQWADTEANDYSEKVADQGGEVVAITSSIETDTSGDYPASVHYRTVTYRAAARIAL